MKSLTLGGLVRGTCQALLVPKKGGDGYET